MSPKSAVEVMVDNLDEKVVAHEERCQEADKGLWTAVEKIRDRLPNWAVVVFALLTGVVGWLGSALWE